MSSKTNYLFRIILSCILTVSAISAEEIQTFDKVYLTLDNRTLAEFDDVANDPFLVIRTKVDRYQEKMAIEPSWNKFAQIDIFKAGQLVSHQEEEKTRALTNNPCPIAIINSSTVFDHAIPYFELKSEVLPEKVWWQISTDPDFKNLAPNFEAMQPFTERVCLDSLTDTFFNSGVSYYFRIRAMQENMWSDWSSSFMFEVMKPAQVKNISIRKTDEKKYILEWEKAEDSETTFHVFASQSLDFIPEIYTDKQINKMCGVEVLESAPNVNLIISTKESEIEIDACYPYYRIIAECKGHYSVPSTIVYFYDDEVELAHDVLQRDGEVYVRVIFPGPYGAEECLLPFQKPVRPPFDKYSGFSYQKPSAITDDMWLRASPFLLPDNHPAKAVLDRLCSQGRFLHDATSLVKAGFINIVVGKYSKCVVASHRDVKGYIFKLHYDVQMDQDDWPLIMRCRGASFVQEAIDQFRLGSIFVVPKKWLYPISVNSSARKGTRQKYFILVAEYIKLESEQKNSSMWKNNRIMTKDRLKALHLMLKSQGLNDSVYPFNVPFTADGRNCFIDTQHHHNNPVYYHILNKYLSKQGRAWWQEIVNAN